MQDLPIDHDTHWKDLIEKLPGHFTQLFLPHIYPLVDWNKPVTWLQQEFHKLIADKHKGDKVINDKLLKLHLKDGTEQWVLIHIEVESGAKANVPERMFVYFYRIFDKEGKVVTALVIFSGDSVPKNHDRYEYDLLGTELVYKYNTYCVKDADEEELLKSDNPLAMAVLAAIYVNRSKKKGELRLQYKLKLIELLRERDYGEKEIDALVQFINLLMVLPKEMEQKFEDTITEIYNLKEKKMDAVSQAKMKRFGDKLVRALYGDSVADEIVEERKKVAQLAKEKEEAAQLVREKEKEAAQLAREKKEAAAQLVREKEEAAAKLEAVASELLKTTDMTVQRIAEMLGLGEQKVLDIQAKISGE